MAKNVVTNGEPERNTEKGGRRGCRTIPLVFILVFCGGCLLSILAHPVVAQLDIQKEAVAEICIGEIYYQGDLGPIKRQGVWIASPFLPYFEGHLMSFVTTHKLVCGIIPWPPRLPYFTMLVIRPFGIYSPLIFPINRKSVTMRR